MIPMFLGAAIEPKLIFIAVAIVVGIVNALLEKKKKAREAANDSAPTAPRPQDPSARSADEQERLRRFMESLGVPQPAQQQRPRPASAPAVSRPQQQPQISRRVPQMQAQKPAAKNRVTAVAKPTRAREPEMARAGRIEEAASSIEAISGEFGTMNVHVAMQPVKPLERPARLAGGAAGTTSVAGHDIGPIAANVRRLLQKPADLRAAFVAVEILGPPRGLQS